MKEDSLLSRIFINGFFAVIFGGFAAMIVFIIYWAVTRPSEALFLLLVIIGFLIACSVIAFVWYGLIWLVRCEIKWVKKVVETTMGICVIVLMIAGSIFLLSGLFNLYRRHRFYLFIITGCAIFLAFYYFAGQQKSTQLRD